MLPVSHPWDLIILGGGAAGFFAASAAADACSQSSNSPKRILILEKARQPLGKVRISGGGRCNLTHACFVPASLVTYYPRGSAELHSAFARFQPRDTMDWFKARGVALKSEADGRVFPESNSSKTIVDCLLAAAEQAKAALWTQTTVAGIDVLPGGSAGRFQVVVQRNGADEVLIAKNVLLATGGDPAGFALAASLGHMIVPPVPSLFTFKVSDARIKDLAGLSVPQARLRLHSLDGSERAPIPPQEGPLLITHWGLSGPAVLRLSAWGARWLNQQNYQAGLEINWLHPRTPDQTLEALKGYRLVRENSRRNALATSPFAALPSRLWQRLATASGIQESQHWADLSKITLIRLGQELCAGRFVVQGKGEFKDEFVTCGGIQRAEVDFKTMQSRLTPGLFFAGEVLDIDGLTGGFNFQNAWTTAWIAGRAIGIE